MDVWTPFTEEVSGLQDSPALCTVKPTASPEATGSKNASCSVPRGAYHRDRSCQVRLRDKLARRVHVLLNAVLILVTARGKRSQG